MLFPVLVLLHLHQLGYLDWTWESFTHACRALDVNVVNWWGLNFEFTFGKVVVTSQELFYTSLWYAILALPCLLAGELLWWRWRHARTFALMIQIVALAMALALYANRFHSYLYGVMLIGVILVFNLRRYEVKIAF